MKVDYVEETAVKKALTFEVEPERVQQEIDTRARELARKVKLPGFRPGKVGLLLDHAVEQLVERGPREDLDPGAQGSRSPPGG